MTRHGRKYSTPLLIVAAIVLLGAAPAPTIVAEQVDPAQEESLVRQESRAEEQLELARSDLEAQNAMAHWTRVMSIAAICGLALSSIGIGLVFVTFKETRKAARSAANTHKAFVDAERGRLRVRTRQAQLQSDGTLLMQFYVDNTGRSDVTLDRFYVASSKTRIFIQVGPSVKIDDIIVRPTDTINVPREWRIKEFHPESQYLWGFIDYRSTFGMQHRAHFFWRMKLDDLATHGEQKAWLTGEWIMRRPGFPDDY